MTKIEEIFKKYNSGFSHKEQYPPWYEDIVEMMKEYAEWYAKECLKIAADEAIADMSFMNSTVWVHKDSILNIELPNHD